MAAELLLLQSTSDQMAALLVEEPEAHLHPQLQVRFMQMLEERLRQDARTQIILTTHSPLLAAGADLDSMVLCAGSATFPLRRGLTQLADDDYAFLRRFLDATKANLFFARGVLIVEGDAENLLIPAIARKLGRSLTSRGVSIVKVGHTGLFRYSRIFQRTDGLSVPIPVACIADRDIPPREARGLDGERPRKTESDWSSEEIEAHNRRLRRDEGYPVRVFVSHRWTLEFDLAHAGLAVEVHQAVALAQAPPDVDRQQLLNAKGEEVRTWQNEGLTPEALACRVYKPLYCGRVSKAQVAEQLAWLLEESDLAADELRERLPSYLVEAIEYVTDRLPSPETGQNPRGDED